MCGRARSEEAQLSHSESDHYHSIRHPCGQRLTDDLSNRHRNFAFRIFEGFAAGDNFDYLEAKGQGCFSNLSVGFIVDDLSGKLVVYSSGLIDYYIARHQTSAE